MTPQDKRNLRRDALALAARAVGLSYGPCECRPADADDHIQVNTPANDSYTTVIPVQYVLTRNRGILETVCR